MNFKIVGIAVGASIMALMSAAHADPILDIQIYDGGTLLLDTGAVSGGFANPILMNPDGNFSQITVNATGVPLVPSPDLATITLDASSTAASTPATLTIYVAQQNVSPFAGGLDATFTVNSLIGSFGSITEAQYADNNNTLFGTGTTIGSIPFSGTGSAELTNGFTPSGHSFLSCRCTL